MVHLDRRAYIIPMTEKEAEEGSLGFSLGIQILYRLSNLEALCKGAKQSKKHIKGPDPVYNIF